MWLTNNRAYAIAPREEEGLGLEDVDPQLPGLILIGRRGLGPNPRGFRRRLIAAAKPPRLRVLDA